MYICVCVRAYGVHAKSWIYTCKRTYHMRMHISVRIHQVWCARLSLIRRWGWWRRGSSRDCCACALNSNPCSPAPKVYRTHDSCIRDTHNRRHDSCIRDILIVALETWLMYTRHDSCIRDMTHVYETWLMYTRRTGCYTGALNSNPCSPAPVHKQHEIWKIYMWHVWYIYVTWNMKFSKVRTAANSHGIYVSCISNLAVISMRECVAVSVWLSDIRDMTHIHERHDSDI
jgi:hypothetical protein